MLVNLQCLKGGLIEKTKVIFFALKFPVNYSLLFLVGSVYFDITITDTFEQTWILQSPAWLIFLILPNVCRFCKHYVKHMFVCKLFWIFIFIGEL